LPLGVVDIVRSGLHHADVAPVDVINRTDPRTTRRPVSLGETVGASVAMVLSAVAVVLLGYLAFAIASIHSVVEESLPCEPSVILDTDPMIDPLGYNQFSEAEVQASKQYDACMSDSLALFASEGLTGRSEVLTWLLIIPADILAALLIGASWAVAVSAAPRRWVVAAMSVLTVGSLIAASFQFRYADTIELVSWITN
jgi:hypothetical protein